MKPKNIVLIIIDACRADHLSCYGYNKKTSPNIDKLAKEGILFENAFSCANATDPSITTILSGKYPISHGIRNHGPKITNSIIQEFYKRKIKFLSEILRDGGYATFGVDWIGRWHKKGFDYYLGDHTRKQKKNILTILIFSKIVNRFSKKLKNKSLSYIHTATELTDVALELISNCNRPFFLFIHYGIHIHPTMLPKIFMPNLNLKKKKMVKS